LGLRLSYSRVLDRYFFQLSFGGLLFATATQIVRACAVGVRLGLSAAPHQ
jgi:hypothetical protein